MSMIVASLIFVVLLAFAIAHLLWAVGAPWPIRDRELLARAVIGRPGVSRVAWHTALVRGALALAAGITALALADHTAGGVGLTLIGIVLAIVCLGRGALGYTRAWRARFSVEPFATLDRTNYSPLALVLGVGFALLVVMRVM